jgi:ABC-type branched-subunit amino acid transport system ATPase component/branched-subunit amino acid ABC-type transport system permease component
MTVDTEDGAEAGTGRVAHRVARPAAAAAGAAALWAVADRVLPNGAPPGEVLAGAILGSATGLTAVGLILVWRASRVINFANGAMAGVAGLTAVHLFLSWGWPYPVTLVVAPLLGLAVGALVEVVVVRRFADAPRLVLTVATIGLAQLLGGIELLVPQRVFDAEGLVIGAYETPLSPVRVEVGPALINGNHLLAVAVVPVVVGALAWFLRRSLAGTAVRAAAENTDRARLLGIPVRNLTTVVWALAGGLAALTFVLQAPFLGAAPSAAAGPAVLLPALAAAIVARMESLPVAFGAAVGIGVLQELVRWNADVPALVDVVLLAVILVALLVGERRRSRAFDTDGGWRNADLVRPLVPAVAALVPVRVARRVGLVVLVATAVVLPLLLSPGDAFSASILCVWGIVAVSLVVLTGWAGQISLGQFAIVGAAAIVAGNLFSRWDLDLFLTLAVATATGALVAVVLGVPALRIRGPFLAVVTLAFAVVLDGYLLNPNVFPDLIPQTVLRPVLWGRVDLEVERNMLWFCLAALALCIALARGVRRSRSGRLLVAARDNRKAAEAASVPSRWATLQGFVLAGALAGLAGGLHVLLLRGARQGSYQVVQSVEVFSGATIGGLGSLGGAIAGAAGLRGAQDLDATLRLVAAGVGVLVVLWLVPAGLAGLAARLRDLVVRPFAARAGIDLDGRPLAPPEPSGPATAPVGAGPAPDPAGAAPTPGAVVPPPFVGHVDGTMWHRPEPLLDARGVDAGYGRIRVLFDVDLAVDDGEIVALLGTNGAGKSTLLRAVCGLTPRTGRVRLGGVDLDGCSAEEVVRRGVALMPGGRAVFPTLTVADHLRLSCWTFRTDRERVEASLAEVHELFPVLSDRSDQLAGDLSGGEQQQLALAMTLLLRPRVLLIDELSLGLAPLVVASLCDVVRRLNERGMTVVVVEQSVNVALTLARRAVFMEKGTVRFEGPTRELLERPDLLRSVFLEGAGPAGGGSADGPAADAAADAGAEAGDGAVIADIDLTALGAGTAAAGVGNGGPQDLHAGDDAVLECRDVTKRFGGIEALSHVDLRVRAGEIVGLIGQNGAGKTTLIDCVSGFHDLDGGAVLLRGVDVSDWAPHERARGRLGRTFQEARLFPSLTVAETLAVACERTVGNRSMVADATRLPASYLAEDRTDDRVGELLRLLGLDGYAHTPTSALSTGTRRIVELGCLLAEDPVVMLLDEPSAGVAQRETEALGPLLRRIRDHTGAAMVVIEHDMALLSGLCDRLVAMELGQVLVEGPPAEVLSHPAVVASYLGTDAAAIHRSGVAVG